MRQSNPIRTLSTYKDMFEKSKHDFKRYKETSRVYDLVDCLLTLNALPEWIKESSTASDSLKTVASEKIEIMKGNNFSFDESKLESDIEHQLRFVRLFCNHVKHANPKKEIPKISMGATFPISFPIKFDKISVGNGNYDATKILKGIVEFWESKITCSGQQ